MCDYLPEGHKKRLITEKLSEAAIKKYIHERTVLEAQVIKSDSAHNLYIDLGECTGFMPREETVLGIKEGNIKDIAVISRVNKTVCFVIKDYKTVGKGIMPILSRADVQKQAKEYILNTFLPGRVIPATVTHIEPFGAFVDIGCGICSLIPIDSVSVSRISHPSQRFFAGQKIYAVVKEINGDRVFLSHKELLGTWEENAAEIDIGQTVTGIIRSVESYGTFIEIAPNLAGLADTLKEALPGQTAAVYIKNILPEKMKIKLNIISLGDMQSAPTPLNYRITDGSITRWDYSPKTCPRKIYSEF